MSAVRQRMESICEECRKPFRPFQGNQRWCSTTCKTAPKAKPRLRTCAHEQLAAAMARLMFPKKIV